jgi:NAD(P)H-dependent flavin oxidoreductase YrpB (nitropropane dioxygenase family)
MQISTPHKFHIPVMGLAYSIDSPIKVACYGINSAISIIEDNLLETMRKHYSQKIGDTYVPISTKEKDYRVKRISSYLNLVQSLVNTEFEKIKTSTFTLGSDLMKYFEMLPETGELKRIFQKFILTRDPLEKENLCNLLKEKMKPGAIEVNIMTKVDKDNLDKEDMPIPNASDALTALRAYAISDLKNSAVIFSAGLNPRLYNYMENFREFDAVSWGIFHKKVVIKVSDYRSAIIQGKYLAKKGIWVSEFRIESGLNCGGHVFATPGLLMGPILNEFKEKKEELRESLFSLYNPAIIAKGQQGFTKPHPVKITVQGGIGTSQEDDLLHNYYKVDSTGWGTPFLLCPEATTVDKETLQVLLNSKGKDVVRSQSSPLGVGFNYLKGTSAETERLNRIEKGAPGSPCTEKFLVSNTEFTKKPICTASRKYQKLKLQQLEESDLSEREYQQQKEDVLSKECLCVGLSNAAPLNYEVLFLKKQKAVTICPGPNIVNFSKLSTLREMSDHIYGRSNLMHQTGRPHMFVREIELYIDFLEQQITRTQNPEKRMLKKWETFCNNLIEGVNYYAELAEKQVLDSNPKAFESSLKKAELTIQKLKNSILQTSL